MYRNSEQQKAAHKVTLIGAIMDGLLGCSKILIGQLSNSAGLIADGIHSLSDLFTDFIVLLILKFSGKKPDKEHPWGHAHFETLGTVLLGSLLIAIAGAMIYDSTLALITAATLPIPEWPTLVVAAISVAAKEWIYRYTLKVGKQAGSDLLIANAWHSRTDALSSIVVFFGIIGTMAGIIWLDAVAAIIVAVFVAKIGWGLWWKSIKQLVATALPEEDTTRYQSIIKSVDGIISVHGFKSRAMGSKNLLELHLQVAPDLSVSEGHHLGDLACNELQKQCHEIGHIIYHIDTYNDEKLDATPPDKLPARIEISNLVREVFSELAPDVGAIIKPYQLTLHYLPHKVNIEVLLHEEDLLRVQNSGYNTEQLIDLMRLKFEHGFPNQHFIGSIYLAAGILK